MTAYYNEFDPFAAAWLRELIKDGFIADGVVDERSIADVRPEDLEGFTQCHFFAGIGGWSAAARLAKWDDDRPMWTGSPPCQPFSTAGNKKGKDDLRHLWPVFFNLIRERRPPVVFGEQVTAAIRAGWFDDLQVDLEKEGYATAMVVLPACSVGAPHRRVRLWTVAERLADSDNARQPSSQRGGEGGRDKQRDDSWRFGSDGNGVANPNDSGQSRQGEFRRPISTAPNADRQVDRTVDASLCSNFWERSEYIHCRDGKARQVPTEPALFPLANGISNRVGVLRGAGNAIVPQVAAEIIGAYMDGI